jgi:hypothetical protein
MTGAEHSMSTTEATTPPDDAPKRGGRGRKPKYDGPKAKFSELLPYLLEHKRVLGWVVVLSILGAAASLAQPLLVNQVIVAVESGDALGPLVGILVTLVVAAALLSGFQHYLLQRTGTSVVLLRPPPPGLPDAAAPHQRIRHPSHRRPGLPCRLRHHPPLRRHDAGAGRRVGGALLFVGSLIAMLIIDPVLSASRAGDLRLRRRRRHPSPGASAGRQPAATGEGGRRLGRRRTGGQRHPHRPRRERDRA